jgi:glycerol-3-phosphate O-acyltransferase
MRGHDPRETGSRPIAAWPESDAGRVVFLLDVASGLEQRLLEAWIDRSRPQDVEPARVEALPIPPTRRRRREKLDPRLEPALASGDDPLLAPLRVAWLPAQHRGVRKVRLRDLLLLGDPRDPGLLRQAWVRWRHPDRCRVVAGEPANLSELRDRWQRRGGTDTSLTGGLADFVARQAALALERAERRLRGARYKVPRLVPESILARPAFRGGLTRLARELGRKPEDVERTAARYLREIAAAHSPRIIDLVCLLWRFLYRRGYGGRLHYDREQLEGIASLSQRYPVAFLPTHKSNLDHPVLQSALHENGLPPTHTAGGINMNFFPMGLLFRRAGVFFIRRSFKDNEVYKFVLRHYVDYLIEKRFSLEWFLEGGRSRSGKLLPPRYGLFSYVVDAYRRGRAEDVFLIPVSIAYDQIADVGDYAAEARGASKRRENFGWFLSLVRRLRRRYGSIHIRFGEPLSLASTLAHEDPGAELDADAPALAVRKVAFESAVRVNRATPITPTSLMTLALLGTGDRALSVPEIVQALENLVRYVMDRKLPTTEELDLGRPEGVKRILSALVETGVVSCYDEGPEPVYVIGPEQHLTAAYYRNTVIHFFVNGAIAELALLHATRAGGGDARETFWNEALQLRDLLKFEFFFTDKEEFRRELQEELARHHPEWETGLASGGPAIEAVLRSIRPFSAHRVLRPFLDAYAIAADVLKHWEVESPVEAGRFDSAALALGKQYVLQKRIKSPESVSKVLFQNAMRLARNRGLLDPASSEVGSRRHAFAREVRDAVRRVEAVEALAASRRAGLIG